MWNTDQRILYGEPNNNNNKGISWPKDYLEWERTMDHLFWYYDMRKQEKLPNAIKKTHQKCILMVEKSRLCKKLEKYIQRDFQIMALKSQEE